MSARLKDNDQLSISYIVFIKLLSAVCPGTAECVLKLLCSVCVCGVCVHVLFKGYDHASIHVMVRNSANVPDYSTCTD